MEALFVDRSVYRGPRPQTTQDWNTLSTMGVKLVLNLESGFFELSHARVNDEFLNVAMRGMVPAHLEMSDFLPPHFAEIVAALNLMKEFTSAGALVYVHCLHGVDRTGVICAAWRVLYGWSVEQAVQEMLRLGFHESFYWWWLPYIRKNLTNVKAGLK